jgi:hypothetical protein
MSCSFVGVVVGVIVEMIMTWVEQLVNQIVFHLEHLVLVFHI